MDRRSALKNAGIAGVLASGIAPAVHAQEAIRWRLASSFPKSLDTIYGSAETFAKKVSELSSGKFVISVHAAGELMPPFGVVDGVLVAVGLFASGMRHIYALVSFMLCTFVMTTVAMEFWKGSRAISAMRPACVTGSQCRATTSRRQ